MGPGNLAGHPRRTQQAPHDRGAVRPLGRTLLLVSTLALTALTCAPAAPRDPGDPVQLRAGDVAIELGPREILLASGALGLEYFPDENVVPLPAERGLRLLVTAKSSTWLVEGDDLRSLSRAREVLTPGGAGSFDNGYAGVGGLQRGADGTLYAFYHAEDHEGVGRIAGGLQGFHGAVGLARSADGEHWHKLGAVLTAARPKHFRVYPGQAANGPGIPSAVPDRTGRYLHLYYNEFSQVGGRGVQVFLARAPIDGEPPGPGRFRKWYQGEFSQPGLGGEETPVLSADPLDRSNALFPHVAFSRSLDRYVMTLCADYWKRRMEPRDAAGRPILPALPEHRSGIAFAFSRDGIHWGPLHRLFVDWCMPTRGESVSWEPSLLLDDERAGDAGWLVYGYSDRWGDPGSGRTPHHMAGRRVRLRRAADSEQSLP